MRPNPQLPLWLDKFLRRYPVLMAAVTIFIAILAAIAILGGPSTEVLYQTF
jgi:hypothetical protein